MEDESWLDYTTATPWESLIRQLEKGFDRSKVVTVIWNHILFTCSHLVKAEDTKHRLFSLSDSLTECYCCERASKNDLFPYDAKQLLSALVVAVGHRGKAVFVENLSGNLLESYIGCRYFGATAESLFAKSFDSIPANVSDIGGTLDWVVGKLRSLRLAGLEEQAKFSAIATVEHWSLKREAQCELVSGFLRLYGIGKLASTDDRSQQPLLEVKESRRFQEVSIEAVTNASACDSFHYEVSVPKPVPGKFLLFSNVVLALDGMLRKCADTALSSPLFPFVLERSIAHPGAKVDASAGFGMQRKREYFNRLFEWTFLPELSLGRLADAILYVLQRNEFDLDLFWYHWVKEFESRADESVQVPAGDCELLLLIRSFVENQTERIAVASNREPQYKKRYLAELSQIYLESDVSTFKYFHPGASQSDFEEQFSTPLADEDIWTAIQGKSLATQSSLFKEEGELILGRLHSLSLFSLIEWLFPMAIQSFYLGIEESFTDTLLKIPIVQENLEILKTLCDNYCWPEYFENPIQMGIEEILTAISSCEGIACIAGLLLSTLEISLVDRLLRRVGCFLEVPFQGVGPLLFGGGFSITRLDGKIKIQWDAKENTAEFEINVSDQRFSIAEKYSQSINCNILQAGMKQSPKPIETNAAF